MRSILSNEKERVRQLFITVIHTITSLWFAPPNDTQLPKCQPVGYIYVASIMVMAHKNLSVKSDISQTPPSRSGFDSESRFESE